MSREGCFSSCSSARGLKLIHDDWRSLEVISGLTSSSSSNRMFERRSSVDSITENRRRFHFRLETFVYSWKYQCPLATNWQNFQLIRIGITSEKSAIQLELQLEILQLYLTTIWVTKSGILFIFRKNLARYRPNLTITGRNVASTIWNITMYSLLTTPI